MIEENREVHNRRKRGFVYFIRAGDKVKIGFSAKPFMRLSAIQTSHHEDLRIMAYIPGTLKFERRLHQMFRALHVRGEWFQFSPEITEFITRYRKVYCKHKEQTRHQVPVPAPVEVEKKPRQKSPPLPEVTALLKLRRQHGANTAIGHHISVLTEAIPNHRNAIDADQRRHLAATIAMTTARLEILLKEAA